ncbi:MAG: WYL domain-containing protein [Victivallales bacterium]|nr:WYL domain-containing protein [Victivallales bacterium]
MFSKTVKERLSYLELCLYWKGSVNRIDLRSKYEISVPQATQDFRNYIKLAPENILYDKKARAYLPVEKTFEFKFKENRPENILNILTGSDTDKDKKGCVFRLKPYIKKFNPEILTKITRGVLQKNIFLKIEYQSLQFSEPEIRTIYPTSFGYFKGRYHIRAYCFSRQEYRDFVLSRIISVEYKDKVNKKVPVDIDAHSTVAAIIKPHSKLSETQKKCIALEYGMKDGFACITVEKHKLMYLLDELNLVYPELEPPYTALELLNREDIIIKNNDVKS